MKSLSGSRDYQETAFMPNWPWDKSKDPSPETLHQWVRERTQELTKANEALRAQILERKRAEGELRQLNFFLDSIIENIPDMIFMKDAKHLRFVRFNRAGEELLGFKREELIGKSDYDFFPKEEADFFVKKDRETLEAGKVIDIPEEKIMTRTKGLRILHTKKIPLMDREGRAMYLMGISEDITDKKRAEEERLAGEALRRSNRELEQFAYVASHDLQEPLRKVATFGELLKVECHDQLNEKGRGYVDRMQKSASRMQELIQALLAYSHASREAPQPTELDLNVLVKGVMGDLEAMIARTGAQIRVKPLSRVMADRYQMRQLFQNLLSNAIKFAKKGAAPDVEVKMVKASRPDRVAIEVADKGIGFDMKEIERIFQPFERLSGREEFEGTGVGLAICHQIVSRHGGSIRAESSHGKGARFILEIPSVPAKGDGS